MRRYLMSYSKLAEHFKARTPFKYNKEVHFDGTKIIATENTWARDHTGRWFRKKGTDEIVLAEHIEHNGKKYAGRRALARALSVAAAVRHGVRVEDDAGGQRT